MFSTTYKQVSWFAEQINWLVAMSLGTLVVNGLKSDMKNLQVQQNENKKYPMLQKMKSTKF